MQEWIRTAPGIESVIAHTTCSYFYSTCIIAAASVYGYLDYFFFFLSNIRIVLWNRSFFFLTCNYFKNSKIISKRSNLRSENPFAASGIIGKTDISVLQKAQYYYDYYSVVFECLNEQLNRESTTNPVLSLLFHVLRNTFFIIDCCINYWIHLCSVMQNNLAPSRIQFIYLVIR